MQKLIKRQKIRTGFILFSFFLFPAIFYYLSPVIIIQATVNGVISGSFIVFTLLFLASLFFGRAYCGWLCPAAGCQEALFKAVDRKVTKGYFIKWLIWIPWIGAIVYLAIKRSGYHTVDFFYYTNHGLSVTTIEALLIYYAVLFILIVLPAFTIGKRSFCHHLCWMAEFMIIGRTIRNRFKWPSLQLLIDEEKCIACHRCTNVCPMSLEVETMVKSGSMEHSECILCGCCVDTCKKQVIRFSFSGSTTTFSS